MKKISKKPNGIFTPREVRVLSIALTHLFDDSQEEHNSLSKADVAAIRSAFAKVRNNAAL